MPPSSKAVLVIFRVILSSPLAVAAGVGAALFAGVVVVSRRHEADSRRTQESSAANNTLRAPLRLRASVTLAPQPEISLIVGLFNLILLLEASFDVGGKSLRTRAKLVVSPVNVLRRRAKLLRTPAQLLVTRAKLLVMRANALRTYVNHLRASH